MPIPTVLVPKIDIDLMVSAFIQTGAATEVYGDKIHPEQIGRVLWNANLEAARKDLPDRDWSDEIEEIEVYTFHEYSGLNLGPLTSVVYAYEAENSERDGWRGSEACAIVHALYRAIACTLPASSTGPWGVRSPEDLARNLPSPSRKRRAVANSPRPFGKRVSEQSVRSVS